MLRICNSFLDKLFFSSKTCRTEDQSCTIDAFDNCGLIINGEGVYPSQYFVNASGSPDYLKFLQDIRPPYFSDADFDISVEYFKEDSSVESDSNFYVPWDADGACFASASHATTSAIFAASTLLIALYTSL